MASIDELADAIGRAITTGKGDELAAHFAPDAVIWHDTDRKEMDAAAALAGIAGLSHIAADLRVEVVKRSPTADGFVQQFVIHGTILGSGRPLDLHNCIVATVAGGRITRLDEYVDSTAASQFS